MLAYVSVFYIDYRDDGSLSCIIINFYNELIVPGSMFGLFMFKFTKLYFPVRKKGG